MTVKEMGPLWQIARGERRWATLCWPGGCHVHFVLPVSSLFCAETGFSRYLARTLVAGRSGLLSRDGAATGSFGAGVCLLRSGKATTAAVIAATARGVCRRC